MSRASRDEAQRAAAADAKQDDGRNRSFWNKVVNYLQSSNSDTPSFFDSVASSINIMQDRLTRSRMAGDPPEITLIPRLDDFALMDFHRAGEAIEEGRRLVRLYEKRSEEHTSELQSLMRISYAVFCLKKKKNY